NSAMFLFVHSRGCVWFLIAAFSAGNPNASQPIGWSTLNPRILFTRATTSPMGTAASPAHSISASFVFLGCSSLWVPQVPVLYLGLGVAYLGFRVPHPSRLLRRVGLGLAHLGFRVPQARSVCLGLGFSSLGLRVPQVPVLHLGLGFPSLLPS